MHEHELWANVSPQDEARDARVWMYTSTSVAQCTVAWEKIEKFPVENIIKSIFADTFLQQVKKTL